MGQKIHPEGFRVGYIHDWKSTWFEEKNFADVLQEDLQIRDHIVAKQSSLVGSIGVLFQYPNFTELLKTVGVKVEEVKSSPLKAAPNGYEPTSPEARAALDALVKDSYAWFRGLVKERRGMDDELLEKVADGRVFTGTPSAASETP